MDTCVKYLCVIYKLMGFTHAFYICAELQHFQSIVKQIKWNFDIQDCTGL